MGTSMSLNASKTIIVGANGCVGTSTLESILLRGKGEVDVYCGVRNLNKFKKRMLNVPTISIDMNDVEQMTESLRGFDRVFVIVPSDQNRTNLALNVLEAAKAANVSFILLLSVTITSSNTIFGRQFKPLEEKVKSLGIPYTIIRLPMFLENLFMHSRNIAEDDRIYDPRDPREKFSCVAVTDVGKCAAEILLNPSYHTNKTYKLVTTGYSMIDLSIALSKILGKEVKVKETTWEQFRQVNKEANIPEWQIDGTIEWLKYDPNVWITGEDQGAIKTITGDNPVTMQHFVAQHATKFGWRRPLILGGDNDARDDPIMMSRLVYAS